MIKNFQRVRRKDSKVRGREKERRRRMGRGGVEGVGERQGERCFHYSLKVRAIHWMQNIGKEKKRKIPWLYGET